MKKLLLIIIAVMAFTGLSLAQDVYYSGYYNNAITGIKVAAVYKNNTKLYEAAGSTNSESTCVLFRGDGYNTVFWSECSYHSNGSYYYADIWKNGSRWLNSPSDEYRYITDMCLDRGYADVYAVGSMITSGLRRAVAWKGNASESSCNASPYYTMGNSNYGSEALAATSYNGHLFVVGIQYLSEIGDSYRGVLWKDGVEFYNFGQNYKPEGIDYRGGGYIYVTGTYHNGSTDYVKVFDGMYDNVHSWQEQGLAFSSNSNAFGMAVDDYLYYEVGYQGNQLKVWKYSIDLYSHTMSGSNNALRAVIANPKGIYYAGQLNNQGKVWKDGSVLYSPSNCNYIYDLFMMDPTCSQTTYNLPFTEDFQYGSTHWLCWERETTNAQYQWFRTDTYNDYYAGEYYAEAFAHYNDVIWLKSPKINIPAGSGTTTLTFESTTRASDFTLTSGTLKVLVSTASLPLPNTFTDQIWAPTSITGNGNWENVTIDLSAYNGQSIYLGFRVNNATSSSGVLFWGIDNVSITQSAPTQYTITANASPTNGGTVTGGGQYNAGATCTLQATPASGYEFLYWKKGNTQVSTNPNYSFTVTENATYTAYFQQSAPTQYTITVNANNNAWGTVSGGGQYNAGATCTLHATPASGYQFDSWKKNGSVVSTNPNYSFTVTENATYTAYFSAEPVTYYTITTNVTPTGAGTVSGGGTFPAGSSITLTATANPGYTFSQWQDGSTANPRTITVNGDATYTAQFTQDIYTISVYANPANGGTVTGGGAYHYGETPTLTATANSGYEFQGWNDGVSTNPRQITVTGNATYTAIFSEVGATYYVVTTSVSPAGAGTVTGGGAYEAGTVITLAATANPGYTFSQWNDGITQNPRTVTVNSNLSFTAVFTQNIYTITVLANPSNAGTVTGGGAYHYGEIVTLTATAYSGYEFQGWSDGSSQNPHQVTVTGNATYTATFSQSGTTYYTVSTYISPIGAGTVTGAGTYPAGATATLSATANQGYTFSRWNDGSTSNPRTVTVNNNMSFTAIFTAQQYTITVNSNPSNGGTVTGGGTYAYGSTTTLRAIPNSGFEFMQWQDGSMQNPRVITVTGNATYTALFNTQGGTVYTLTVTPNYQLLGQTFGSGTYPAGSTVEIAAYPSEYAVFVQWNDGNTQNPRTVVVNSNVEYIAEFRAANRYTITVESANPNMGEAYGGGTFFEGAVTEISAIPNAGYVFTGWNDGNTQNPRTITVTGDATYTANFSENSVITHTLTVICNTDQGTVSGGGIYMHGATAVIQAFPNQGYVFTKWSDENTENPRMVTMTNDLTLVAFFATGVGENEEPVLMVYPNPTKESIRILGIEANSSVEIYNSLGELVKVVSASEDQEINVRDLASGLYLLRCGNATLRFIKEQ